jgi:hypothetical protein
VLAHKWLGNCDAPRTGGMDLYITSDTDSPATVSGRSEAIGALQTLLD